MIVEYLRPRRAIYEDPAWYPADAGFGAVQPAIRAMKDWDADQLRALSPHWSEANVQAKLDALATWDPDTTRMRYLETAYLPTFPVVPSLILLADPSALIPPPIAERYLSRGGVRYPHRARHRAQHPHRRLRGFPGRARRLGLIPARHSNRPEFISVAVESVQFTAHFG